MNVKDEGGARDTEQDKCQTDTTDTAIMRHFDHE